MASHAAFILAAYTVTGLVIGGLVLRAVLDHGAQTRALADLESRGIGRRSSRAEEEPAGSGRSRHG
jgi:heme exporter protein D